MQKKYLMLAVLTALCAQPSMAQQVETPTDGTKKSDDQAATQETPTQAATAGATDEVAQLEGLTVTAQRREESAQKIPVAVAVVGGEALERANATDIRDLTALVPSVTFSAGNELRNNSIRIRGVGTDVFSTGVEPSVSTVVDGVVLQRPGSAFSDLSDIERIEVLRGPQGTLFGKNSSAGVINVITREPSFDYVTGDLATTIAEDNEWRFNGNVSGPINENLAYRFAGFYRTQDGNVTNLHTGDSVNDQEAYGLRGKLGWRSDDESSKITLSADYSRLDSTCCALPLVVASNNPLTPVTGTPVGPDNDQVNNDVSPFVKQKNYGASLTMDFPVGSHTLTSITAYRKFENISDVDLDDTQGQFIRSNLATERSKTKTQELRLTSPTGGAFDYVVGAYYFDGSVYSALDRRGLNISAIAAVNPDGSVVPTVPGDDAVLAGNSVVDTRNISLFGQGNWHIGDKLTLTLGLRRLKEDQKLDFFRPLDGRFNGSLAPPTNPAFGPVVGRYSDSATIGKGAATYDFTDAITGYVSYSTGYKSEGIAATLGLSAAQFAQGPAPAETSKQWEAGLKTGWLNNRVIFNVTGFRTRFEDYQAQTYNAASGLVVLTSAGGVAIDGVELELMARPTNYLSLTAGLTLMDARFENVPNGPCYTGQTAAQGCLPASPGGPNVQNLNGKPFVNAPDVRYTLSARYQAPLSGNTDWYVEGAYRWQDDVIYDISQNPNLTQGSYGIADLSFGFTFAQGKYELGMFVKNLFDEQYSAGMMAVGSAGGANAYAHIVPRDFNRYVGVTFRAHF